MYCPKCKSKLSEQISFRSTCENCEIDLHVCVNCKNYSIGKPNDCFVPNTEYVSDREKNNYCEDYSPLKAPTDDKKASKDEVSEKLFGEKEDTEKKSFDSLFDD